MDSVSGGDERPNGLDTKRRDSKSHRRNTPDSNMKEDKQDGGGDRSLPLTGASDQRHSQSGGQVKRKPNNRGEFGQEGNSNREEMRGVHSQNTSNYQNYSNQNPQNHNAHNHNQNPPNYSQQHNLQNYYQQHNQLNYNQLNYNQLKYNQQNYNQPQYNQQNYNQQQYNQQRYNQQRNQPNYSHQQNNYNTRNRHNDGAGLMGRYPQQQHQQQHQHMNSYEMRLKHHEKYDPKALELLEEEGIFLLRKKSLKYPRANFFCRLCDYHCIELQDSVKHFASVRHQKLATVREFEQYLQTLPRPPPSQVAAVGAAVTGLAAAHCLSKEQLEQRREAVKELVDKMAVVQPDVTLEMLGSTYSGLALQRSDVNVYLFLPEKKTPFNALMAIKKIITECDEYTDFVDDLRSKMPSLSYTSAARHGCCRVVVGVGAVPGRSMARLLAVFVNIDVRFRVLTIALQHWAKLCNIADQKNGSLPAIAFSVLVAHFLQQTSPPVLPVLSDVHPTLTPEGLPPPDKLKTNIGSSNNTQSIGELWLQMLCYYAYEFKFAWHFINLTHSTLTVRSDKAYGKKMSIEDPFNPKNNLTRSVSSCHVFDHIMDILMKMVCRYFLVPQLSYGPLFYSVMDGIVNGEEKKKEVNELIETFEKLGVDTESSDSKSKSIDSDKSVEESQNTAPSSKHKNKKLVHPDYETRDPNTITSGSQLTHSFEVLSLKSAERLLAMLKKEDYSYRFIEDTFTDGQSVPLFCPLCQKQGHNRADCEDQKLPTLNPLQPVSKEHLQFLSSSLIRLKEEIEPSDDEMQMRQSVVADLQCCIRRVIQDANLQLFGSSDNGFAFANSDLDVCITFSNAEKKNLDECRIIDQLAWILRNSRMFSEVLAITTARVPIVKFTSVKMQLEGDLSLYNTLALHNTKLLRTYSSIDPRVKVLGYGLKYFAKRCDIGDASRGSLSSYAFTLMLIHFLQQCKPPIVPILQQLHGPEGTPEPVLVEGWNTWFFSDLSNIASVWPGYQKNKSSCGELWVQMFRYYTETFNFDDHIITIRQHEPLLRLEKLWNNRCLAIEDPFDLNHNLGGALSRKMNTFIMKAFISGRQLYGTNASTSTVSLHFEAALNFLFDPNQLTVGNPPNDRGCRRCRKIGHFLKDCPRRADDEGVAARRRKEQQQQQRRSSDANSAGQHKGATAEEKALDPKKKDEKSLRGEKGLEVLQDSLPEGGSAAGTCTGDGRQRVGTTAAAAIGAATVAVPPLLASSSEDKTFNNKNIKGDQQGERDQQETIKPSSDQQSKREQQQKTKKLVQTSKSVVEKIRKRAADEQRLKADQSTRSRSNQAATAIHQSTSRSDKTMIRSGQPTMSTAADGLKVGGELMVICSDESSSSAQQHSANPRKTSTDAEESTVHPQEPLLIITTQPALCGHQSPLNAQQPLVGAQQPLLNAHPSLLGIQQPLSDHNHTVGDQQYLISGQQPVISAPSSVISDHKSSKGINEPTVNSLPPAFGGQRSQASTLGSQQQHQSEGSIAQITKPPLPQTSSQTAECSTKNYFDQHSEDDDHVSETQDTRNTTLPHTLAEPYATSSLSTFLSEQSHLGGSNLDSDVGKGRDLSKTIIKEVSAPASTKQSLNISELFQIANDCGGTVSVDAMYKNSKKSLLYHNSETNPEFLKNVYRSNDERILASSQSFDLVDDPSKVEPQVLSENTDYQNSMSVKATNNPPPGFTSNTSHTENDQFSFINMTALDIDAHSSPINTFSIVSTPQHSVAFTPTTSSTLVSKETVQNDNNLPIYSAVSENYSSTSDLPSSTFDTTLNTSHALSTTISVSNTSHNVSRQLNQQSLHSSIIIPSSPLLTSTSNNQLPPGLMSYSSSSHQQSPHFSSGLQPFPPQQQQQPLVSLSSPTMHYQMPPRFFTPSVALPPPGLVPALQQINPTMQTIQVGTPLQSQPFARHNFQISSGGRFLTDGRGLLYNDNNFTAAAVTGLQVPPVSVTAGVGGGGGSEQAVSRLDQYNLSSVSPLQQQIPLTTALHQTAPLQQATPLQLHPTQVQLLQQSALHQQMALQQHVSLQQQQQHVQQQQSALEMQHFQQIQQLQNEQQQQQQPQLNMQQAAPLQHLGQPSVLFLSGEADSAHLYNHLHS